MTHHEVATSSKSLFMTLFIRWLGMTALAFATVEIFYLHQGHVPAKAYMLTLSCLVVLISHILYPEEALVIFNRHIRTIIWSFLTGFSLFIILATNSLLTNSDYLINIEQTLLLTSGVFILSLSLGSITRLFITLSPYNVRTAYIIFLLFILITATPIWLGSYIQYTDGSQATINSVIAISPLTHLSVLIEYDYLRSGWFYSHTPFGEFRYSYPTITLLTASYTLLCLILIFLMNPRIKLLGNHRYFNYSGKIKRTGVLQ